MNKNLPVGHNDPRTQIVPIKYLHLTANLIIAKQNWDYWEAIPVAESPRDRVAFEELRQLTVFLPLLMVAVAYNFFGKIGAGVSLIVVLPLMKMLHDGLQRSIIRQAAAWHARDAGRYAYTHFMCEEFGLQPQEVTRQLVCKMFEDFKTWLAVAKRLSREDAALAGLARKNLAKFRETVPSPIEPAITASTRTMGVAVAVAAGAAIVIGADAVDGATDFHRELEINPATGLPLMDGGMLDIHGNLFGTSNVDDVWNDSSSFSNYSSDSGSGFSNFDDYSSSTDI